MHSDLAPELAKKLPDNEVVWKVLRFAGHFLDKKGNVICVANTTSEIMELRKTFGEDVQFTSRGKLDEQLTDEEFLAWHNREYAARLEIMAEARHRPRPGNAHPDAIVDDPDGVHGGLSANEADFDRDDALPGQNSSDEDNTTQRGTMEDPEIYYKSNHRVGQDEFLDVVHRYPQLKKQLRDTSATKHKLMKKFHRDHEGLYKSMQEPMAITPTVEVGRSTEDTIAEGNAAFKNQEAIVEKKAHEEDETIRLHGFPTGQQADPDVDVDVARRLETSELPPSPLQMAVPLIATSGVSRSKQQYNTATSLLLPIQQLWLNAHADGNVDLMRIPSGLPNK